MKKFNEIREENEKTASKLQEETKDQKWVASLYSWDRIPSLSVSSPSDGKETL